MQQDTKLPKALLQQHCQKRQWPTPRFERGAMGGHRLLRAGIRYAVTLDMTATNGRNKKARLHSPCFCAKLFCIRAPNHDNKRDTLTRQHMKGPKTFIKLQCIRVCACQACLLACLVMIPYVPTS